MGAMSRTKGQSGEREAAAVLSELTGRKVARRVRQHEGDSDLTGLENWGCGWCVEVKRVAKCQPSMLGFYWEQAVTQAKAAGLPPLLMVRENQKGWVCYWPSALHHGDGGIYDTIADTLHSDPATWWAMVRKLPANHNDDAHRL